MSKTISKFNAMYPEHPEYTEGNHMYTMYGVDPLYYTTGTTQEKQFAPLSASPSVLTSASVTGNITHAIPAGVTMRTGPNTIDIFLITDQGNVYGYSYLNSTIVISLGTVPTGVASDYRLSIGFNGQLVASTQSSSSFWTNPINGATFPDTVSTTWTARNPGDYLPLGNAQIEPFQNYIAASTRSATGATTSVISLYNYANNFAAGASAKIDLGNGWQILRLVNYDNRYIVAGAYYSSNMYPKGGTGTAPQSSISTLFFWNGQATSTSRYQFSIKLQGNLIDVVYSSGVLYALVQERTGQYSLYRYSGGTKMTKYMDISFDTPVLVSGSALFEYPSGVGINLSSQGAYVITEKGGELFKYVIFNQNKSSFVMSAGVLYGIIQGGISYQPISPSAFSDMDCTTQWIPLDTKLSSVDVWYESAPTVAGEYIRITATVWSEDQYDGVMTKILNDITSTVKDTNIKTTLDTQGLTGTKMKLRIQTHSLSSWRPIIRKIQLNESKE